MASPIAVDATARMPMPKKAGSQADQFRSILEHSTPTVRRQEQPAPDDEDAQVLVEPLPVVADEETAVTDEPDGETDPADDEHIVPAARGDKGDADPAALPNSPRAVEELRQLLGGSTRKPAEDEPAAAARLEAPAADENVATNAANPAKRVPAESSAVASAVAPASAMPPKPAPVKPAPAHPAEPAAAPAIDPRAAADGAELPAVRPTPSAGDRDGAGDPRQDTNRRGQGEAKPLPGVTVVADAAAFSQAAPQPATRTVVATLGADPAWAAYFRAKPEPTAQSTPQSLTIQLRPAELGVVTAHLRFAGERVAVELQAETAEARRQLSADTDTIARSLRAAGLEVDQVTVQPAPQVQDTGRGTLPGRGDGAGGGAAFASQEGASEHGGRQAGSNGSQGFSGHGGSDEIRTGAGGADRDGGRYI